ncbi:MAG: phospholipase [Chloroflexi bacterium]|nr:phospholipase [Chloroflexota bacterium]
MPLTMGDFKVYLGPKEQGGEDALVTPIVELINKAQKRQKLMIAVQEIENRQIVEALVKARQKGVTIDIVIEQDYLLSKKIPADPFVPGGANEKNRFLLNALLRANIDVKSDFNSKIFHQKFMVLGNTVLTGSTNFTDTGLSKNLNHIIVINDAEIANAYKHEFREIQKGRFGKESVTINDKPREARVSNVRVKPLFAPDHSPEMEIMKHILKAKERIDFAVFTFSQSSGIDDALIAASKAGTQITGILDRRQANQKWAATHPLAASGVQLSIAGNRNGLGKLHHKLMTIDDTVTILGSFNYTGPANKTNDENILVVGDPEETNPAAVALQKQISLHCRTEIDRIAATFGAPVP